MISNISLKRKLQLIVFSIVIISSILLSILSIYNIQSISKKNIENYSKEAYKAKEKELENYVYVAIKTIDSYYQRTESQRIKQEVSKDLKEKVNQLFSTIEYQYKKYNGKISQKELKQRIKDIVSSTRYGKNGYYWINDMDAVIIDHPIKPHLNGKNLYNFKDKGGTQLFKEFVDVCKSNGDGFVDYVWPKPGFDNPQPKVSYVKLFKPFNWVIGTGAYVDDISSSLKEEALQAIATIRYGNNGYFWINDMHPKMIMHPIKPSLNGKDLSTLKDPNGVYLFNEMVKVSKNSGGGLVKYSWPKPGEKDPQLKFSYVKHFDKWNWIIGTGVYVDDIKKKIVQMEKETSQEINSTLIAIVISSIIIISILLVIVSYIIQRNILDQIDNFKQGLLSFFKFIGRESNSVEEIKIESNDEIGEMVKSVNEHIVKTKTQITQDNEVLKEIDDVIEKIDNGFFMYKIKSTTTNQEVEILKNKINNLSMHLNTKMDIVKKALMEFGSYNFTYEIDKNENMNGAYGSLKATTQLIGTNVSEMLAMIINSGDRLSKDTEVLSSSSLSLSVSANEQAVSLEETAASLEEIASAITNNSHNIEKMNLLANSVNSSVLDGERLANTTTKSMEEIDKQVNAINEAITVIDQIAFQTNILSLNAAVEAATAGEAGKGFAVVAGEVRNLANRSTEAAKEIKELVQSATQKADEGKLVANNMIDGYHKLNESIAQTISLISEVTNSSKEQEQAIIQINDAIATLDQNTQKNAAQSDEISSVAKKIEQLSKELVDTANQAQFKQEARAQVCDIDLVYLTSKLKNDHIDFKDNNYKQLGDNKHWTVVNHQQCAFGKWVAEVESEGVEFTKSENWKQLKVMHEQVHSGVQSYIKEDSKSASNNKLQTISTEIEKATLELFDRLNNVKKEHCLRENYDSSN